MTYNVFSGTLKPTKLLVLWRVRHFLEFWAPRTYRI